MSVKVVKTRQRTDISDNICEKLVSNDIIIDVGSKSRTGRDYKKILDEVDFNKYERVSDIPQFKQFAKEHQWQDRRSLKYAWRADPFEFLREFYKPWIDAAARAGKRMVMADILNVDKKFWNRLQQEIHSHKHPLPDDIDLPADKDARLESEKDPERRKLIQAHRQIERERIAKFRESQRKLKK